jgi:hypothetical protein
VPELDTVIDQQLGAGAKMLSGQRVHRGDLRVDELLPIRAIFEQLMNKGRLYRGQCAVD